MNEETRQQLIRQLDEVRKRLSELREEIDKARRAGIDVTELEKTYRELSEKFYLLSAVYGK